MPSTVVPETRASRSSTGPLHMTRKSPGRLHRLVDVQAFSLVHAGLWMPGFCFIAFLAIANRTTFQPASHRIPVTLAQTENFANLAIIYVVSINMLPLMWGPMFHAASAVRRAPAVGGRDEAMRSVKKLGPDAILIIAFAVAIFLLDLQSIWSPITAFVVVLPLLALTRAIRIGIVAREYGRSGEGVIAYVENFTRRMLVAVMIEAFCLTYATVTSFESLWVTAPNGEATTYLPSMNYCVKHLNSTYFAAYCGGVEPGVYWWRSYVERIDCDDGGYGEFFKSLNDACDAKVAHSLLSDRTVFIGLVGTTVLALLLCTEVMIGLEPRLKKISISSLSQASGSPIMAAALMSYGFAALLIPSYFARAISISPTNASYSDKMIYFAFPIAVPLMLLLVEALRRKIKPVQKTHYFISYKQDDGNDGASQLLYHSLLKFGTEAWLDKLAEDRSTDGMLKGIQGCDTVLVLLSDRYFHSPYCCLEMIAALSLRKKVGLTRPWRAAVHRGITRPTCSWCHLRAAR